MNKEKKIEMEHLIATQVKRLRKITEIIDHLESLLDQERQEIDYLYKLSNNGN